MRGLALTTGILGFLCMVMGIVTFFEPGFLDSLPTALIFYDAWFWLAGLLLVGTVVIILAIRGSE